MVARDDSFLEPRQGGNKFRDGTLSDKNMFFYILDINELISKFSFI